MRGARGVLDITLGARRVVMLVLLVLAAHLDEYVDDHAIDDQANSAEGGEQPEGLTGRLGHEKKHDGPF